MLFSLNVAAISARRQKKNRDQASNDERYRKKSKIERTRARTGKYLTILFCPLVRFVSIVCFSFLPRFAVRGSRFRRRKRNTRHKKVALHLVAKRPLESTHSQWTCLEVRHESDEDRGTFHLSALGIPSADRRADASEQASEPPSQRENACLCSRYANASGSNAATR